MEEFLKREGGKDGRLPIPESNKDVVLNAASHCEKREKSKLLSFHVLCLLLLWRFSSSSLRLCSGERSCDALADYLAKVGHSPTFRAKDGCVVFDEDAYHARQVTPEHQLSAREFCGVSEHHQGEDWPV